MATGEAAREPLNSGAREIVIRKCEGVEEFRTCVDLQKQIWNFADNELVPVRMFVVAEKVGGQVIGAFDGGQMIGFALSIPGERHGRAYLHSHMLAVVPEYRNAGLGRRIKLFQREDALRRGFDLIEWTFDPLEIKNAFLNLERLGAIARRYNINQYGITSSPLQGGLPTDRLVAEWWLRSKRVETLLNSGSRPPIAVEKMIPVPAEIYAWKAAEESRGRARETQLTIREDFLKGFAHGLAALGYERNQRGDGTFLLGFWDEDWSYRP